MYRTRIVVGLLLALGMVVGVAPGAHAADAATFLGNWALVIPGGGAGWLGITNEQGFLDGSILWGGGSVVPVDSVLIDGDALVVTRISDVERKDAAGKVIDTQRFTDTIRATVSGDDMKLELFEPSRGGSGIKHSEFAGKRIAAVPAAPDISSGKYGKAFNVFSG